MNPVDLWKRCVPRRYQQRVIEARLTGRQVVDSHRPLPDFLVIGAQRAGTSSLYKWLEAHPNVVASLRKETEYLSARWDKGEGWYRGHFPSRLRRSAEASLRGRQITTFEASPNYLFHPQAPARAAGLLPDARLVALLRDPVERAFSQYQHEVRAGREDLSFEEALDREPDRLAGEEERMAADAGYRSFEWERHSYAARGRYAPQLRRWMEGYPPERLLVVHSADLYTDTEATYLRILAFLGLPAWTPAGFGNHSYVGAPPGAGRIDDATRQRLAAAFADDNRRLYELVGSDFGWS
ncbi:MAG: sulfotransferase family protein [Acidimicrobiales bacterium]